MFILACMKVVVGIGLIFGISACLNCKYWWSVPPLRSSFYWRGDLRELLTGSTSQDKTGEAAKPVVDLRNPPASVVEENRLRQLQLQERLANSSTSSNNNNNNNSNSNNRISVNNNNNNNSKNSNVNSTKNNNSRSLSETGAGVSKQENKNKFSVKGCCSLMWCCPQWSLLSVWPLSGSYKQSVEILLLLHNQNG